MYGMTGFTVCMTTGKGCYLCRASGFHGSRVIEGDDSRVIEGDGRGIGSGSNSAGHLPLPFRKISNTSQHLRTMCA